MFERNKALLTIVFLSFFCAAISTAASAQAQKYEELLGTWDVQTEDGSYTFVFEFHMQGDTLAGKYTGSSGQADMEKLTFEDHALKFSVNVNNMVIDFSATISGEKLSGMLSLQYGEGNITGTKRKER
jgi:polyisoprenoid-binding protein YceI